MVYRAILLSALSRVQHTCTYYAIGGSITNANTNMLLILMRLLIQILLDYSDDVSVTSAHAIVDFFCHSDVLLLNILLELRST